MSKPAPRKRSLSAVRRDHDAELLGIDGVVGVGEGERAGAKFIRVYVTRKTPEIEARIPREIDGYRLRIEESGEFDAL